ncbi:MAG: hypothetical protein HRU38_07405 [Saccharospirillaceae bacterium]|nr:hypothetical protein [Pseudomonadales bacterium]NRB78478.1 hypothetical protein [Saccharospirillaceae bacterium]
MQKSLLALLSIMILGCQSTPTGNNQNNNLHKPDIKPHKSQKRLNFGDTCFTLIEDKYNQAQALITEKNSLNKQMTPDILKNIKLINKIKEIDQTLLTIGEPNAFSKQCYFAADNLAPAELRDTGQQWCAIGLKIMPILNSRVDIKLIEKIKTRETEDSNFSMSVKIKEQSMCKI